MVENLLKFDPNSTELLAQKQQLLTDAIANTTNKLDTLKAAQKQVAEQFDKGEITAGQYRAFQRELEATEQLLSKFQSSISALKEEEQQLADKTKQLSTFFAATKSDVSKYADVLGKDLIKAIQDGKASSSQLDDAIDKIGKSAYGSKTDIDKLKEALKSIDDGKSLANVKDDLSKIAKEANNAEKEVGSFGDKLKAGVGGAIAGIGIGAIVDEALDTSSLNTNIDISFNVPEESKQSIKEALNQITAYGLDGEEALEGLRRQWALNKDASDAANTSFVENAAVIARAYGSIDFTELIQETNELASSLGLSNDDALALTNALLKAGFPPEQLDTISEYGQQMKDAGFNAQQIQAIFEAGIDTKTWNIDNLNDGVKEARLQMATFGQESPKTLGTLLEQAGIGADRFQLWGKAVAEGGQVGADAMSQMVTWLDGIEDKTLKNQIATQVFGTKWEDQGENVIAVFKGIGDAQDKTKENQDQLNGMVDKLNADPVVQMKEAFGDMMIALAPVLTAIAGFIGKIAEWASNNPGWAATIGALAVAIGLVVGAIVLLLPLLTSLIGAGIGLAASFGLIIGVIAAVVVAIGLIGIAVYEVIKHWDTIKEFFVGLWDWLKDFFSKWGVEILAVVAPFIGIPLLIVKHWDEIKTALSNVWNWIKSTSSSIFQSVVDGIMKRWNDLSTGTVNLWKTIISNIQSALQWVMDLPDKMLEIGKNIIQGIIDGISSGINKLWNKVKEIASTITDGIKGLLDIHSPSHVMKTLGRFVVDGFALGIQDSINSVKTQASSLAKAAVPKSSDMLPAVTGVNGTAGYGASFGGQFTIEVPVHIDGREVSRAIVNPIQNMNMTRARGLGLSGV
ncbi:replication protein [Paenibacillus glycanilyticus]|uniref:phage tail protein n=1 Tax=Paenibacillus glycanilyticus TaxID=126569 RepID=UPI00203C968E|nr:replication protein [Paenibacillus glycanilyticus]MCM3628805.1 replication protein [Paenibacillus glycanilyticus]